MGLGSHYARLRPIFVADLKKKAKKIGENGHGAVGLGCVPRILKKLWVSEKYICHSDQNERFYVIFLWNCNENWAPEEKIFIYAQRMQDTSLQQT